MPPKSKKGDEDSKPPPENNKKGDGDSKPPKKKGTGVICNNKSPGPKYKLATLVGYKGHDTTKYRNPAYSFRGRQVGFERCEGPGPKYMLKPEKSPAFSIGFAMVKFDTSCGPGPHKLPPPCRGPAFTIKSRTPYRRGGETPGPYKIPSPVPGPAFSLAARPEGAGCVGGPGAMNYDINVIKPRAPAWSLGLRQTGEARCAGAGPGPTPELCRGPLFSFGIKHSECLAPYRTECDDIC